MTDNKRFDASVYQELLNSSILGEQEQAQIRQLVQITEELQAENVRLRQALRRLNSTGKSKMSTKLKEALYE